MSKDLKANKKGWRCFCIDLPSANSKSNLSDKYLGHMIYFKHHKSPRSTNEIFITNIPYYFTDNMIRSIFESFGTITNVYSSYDYRIINKSLQYYVTFKDKQAIDQLYQSNFNHIRKVYDTIDNQLLNVNDNDSISTLLAVDNDQYHDITLKQLHNCTSSIESSLLAYKLSHPNINTLHKNIENFMYQFDQREKLQQKARKSTEPIIDQDGFILVVNKKKRGKEYLNEQRLLSDIKVKKKSKYLPDFYQKQKKIHVLYN